MGQVKFTNPRTNATYTWPINPGWDAEPQRSGKQRQIDRASNTGNVGATKQQGDDGPYIIHWEFEVFHSSLREALWQWWATSKLQTIYLTDSLGEEFEGQIVTLQQSLVGAAGGPGDTNANVGYWKFIFEFEVYRFISGAMALAGVTP